MQGMGLDVLSAVLRQTAPSHVVVLSTGNPSKDPPAGSFWQLPSQTARAEAVRGSRGSVLVTLPAAPTGAESCPELEIDDSVLH